MTSLISVNSFDLDNTEINYTLHMERAIALAQNVLTTTPNPRVGCVLLDSQQQVIGEGWHAVPGQAHAEVNALNQVNVDSDVELEVSIAFVSLEPCAHQGKTPPCARALIDAGIKQVFIAALDPFEKVAGKGVKLLEAAGVKVVHLKDFEQRSNDINRGYLMRQFAGRPFVRCKLAMSLDGRTAAANRESKWITGPAARSDVQKLRVSSCAIVTGINTVLDDDPSMTVRQDELGLTDIEISHNGFAIQRQPLRVILDSTLRTPAKSRLVGQPGKTIIFTASGRDQKSSQFPIDVEVIPTPLSDDANPSKGRVDPLTVLELLASKYDVNEVLLEAGPVLCGAFMTAGLVDELVIYIGASFLGNKAMPLLDLPELTSMDDKISLSIKDVQMIGDDCRIVAGIN